MARGQLAVLLLDGHKLASFMRLQSDGGWGWSTRMASPTSVIHCQVGEEAGITLLHLALLAFFTRQLDSKNEYSKW